MKSLAAGVATSRLLSAHKRLLVIEQLSRLMRAGISLESAAPRLIHYATDRRTRAALSSLFTALKNGAGLSTVASPIFTAKEQALLAAGERTGHIAEVLERIAVRIRMAIEMRRRLWRMAIYPLLLIALSAFILPIPVAFRKGLTAYLVEAVSGCGFVALVTCLLAFAPAIARSLGIEGQLRAAAWRVPLLRGLYRRIVVADALEVLATSLAAGLPMFESLALSSNVSQDPLVKKHFKDISSFVDAGGELANGIAKTGLLDGPALMSIAGAEYGGCLAEGFREISSELFAQFEHRLTIALRVGSVAMLLLAAGLVASRILDAFSDLMHGSSGSLDELEREILREMPIRRLR